MIYNHKLIIMKKVMLSFLILVSFYSNSQEVEFTFTSEKGLTDFIVTPVEGKAAADIYKKIIDWIKVTYKDPSKVILSTIENEYIRFEGASSTIYCINAMGKTCYNTKYQIEISIKDGKYKFDIVDVQSYIDSWIKNPVFNDVLSKDNSSYYFKKDGTLKNNWTYLPEFPKYFNNLNKLLLESIVSKEKKNDNW